MIILTESFACELGCVHVCELLVHGGTTYESSRYETVVPPVCRIMHTLVCIYLDMTFMSIVAADPTMAPAATKTTGLGVAVMVPNWDTASGSLAV